MAWGRNVSHLLNLNALNSAVNTKVLDLQKVKEIVDELREYFFQMQTEFNLSPTLKLHILFDHYVEHEMTGESLLKYSDEICEAMHSQYRIFEEKHKYTNNNKNTDSHKKSQLKSMVYFNSLNLGDV